MEEIIGATWDSPFTFSSIQYFFSKLNFPQKPGHNTSLISSNKAASFGIFQQSLLFPNERINIDHGRYDIFMGISKES